MKGMKHDIERMKLQIKATQLKKIGASEKQKAKDDGMRKESSK